jgi:Ca-activated chloride channel family protein
MKIKTILFFWAIIVLPTYIYLEIAQSGIAAQRFVPPVITPPVIIPINSPYTYEGEEDKTMSPYFYVKDGDPDTDRLPLERTRVDAKISGVIAQVKVTQVYQNKGENTLEAIYIFPASSRAAVHAMKMTIGDRVIEAQIKERKQARLEYETAKESGKTSSLLEQQRPNVFQMNVANILPGDKIIVEMEYTELLVPKDNVYEFVYPTVVGPRYSNRERAGAPDTENWVETPYQHQGEGAAYSFGLDLTIRSGIPISSLTCPSHNVTIVHDNNGRMAEITLPESNSNGNRDFVLRYSLAGDIIESGLLLYNGAEENFFLLMMEPPERVEPEEIVPREYVFIIDVSGSMYGYPLDISKKLMLDLLGNLRPCDFFDVILFSGGNTVMSERSVPATPENIETASNIVTRQHGGGGTELIPALRRALSLPRIKGTSRIIVLATDGYVQVEREAFNLIRDNLNNANLFTFGIGASVNRYLIEGMARAGMGEPFVVLNQQEAEAKAKSFSDYISSPLLTDIQVDFSGFDTYDVEPPSVPDLFSSRPIIIFGKYRGELGGEITISGSLPGKKLVRTMKVKDGLLSDDNDALRCLWARQRLMRLSDLKGPSGDQKLIDEITSLGLTYNLMSEFTSFVAVDMVVRANGEKLVTVKQPIPLPQGVSDYSVGGEAVMSSRGGNGMNFLRPPCPMAITTIPPIHKIEGTPTKGTGKISKSSHRTTITIQEQTIATDGPISKEDLIHYIQTQLPKVIACCEGDSGDTSSIIGKITLGFTIDSRGKVSAMNLISSTIKSKTPERCLRRAMKEVPWPTSKGITKVTMTFNFTQ